MAENLGNLIDQLRSLNESQPATGALPPLGIGGSGTPSAVQPYVPTKSEAGMGAVNIFAGFLRGITSIGRGIVNYAGEVLPYANQMYDSLEDGFQAKDAPALFDAAANATWQGLGGFAKGLAYSFMPPTAASRKSLREVFGGDVYEGAYELFKSKDFEEAGENLPFLKEAASEEGVGWGIPDEWIGFDVPFLGIQKGKGLEFTKAGLYSFAFDALTDPISYTPLGFGGAARGLKSGIKGVAEASAVRKATAGAGKKAPLKPEETAVLREATAPKELYPELRPYSVGEEGTLYREAVENADVAYHALDTNPLTYIGKEMARGVGSSWRAIKARSAANRIARVSRRSGDRILEAAMLRSVKNTGEVPDLKTLYSEADSIIAETKQSILKRIKDAKVDKKTKAELEEKFLARIDALDAARQAPDVAAKFEAKAAKYKTLLENIPPEKRAVELRVAIANEAAHNARLKTKLVTKKAPVRVDAKSVTKLGDDFVALQDAAATAIKGKKGKPTSRLWEEFSSNKDITPTTKKAVLESIFGPLISGAKGTLTTAQTRELSGLVLGDITRKQPRATKGKGVKGEEMARPTELADVIAEARVRLEALAKAQLKNIDPAKVTGEMFEEALGGQYRLAGERLRQLGLEETKRLSRDYDTLIEMRDTGYNPLTVTGEPKYFGSVSMRVSGTNARSSQLRQLYRAGGDYYPEEVVSILVEAGVKGLHGLTFQELKIKASEALEALTYLSARRADRVTTAEMYEAKLGNLKLSNIVRANDDSLSAELKRIERTAETLFPGAGRVTKKRIDDLAKRLDSAVSDSVDAARELPNEIALSGMTDLGSSLGTINQLSDLLNISTVPGASDRADFIRSLYDVSNRATPADGGRFRDYVNEEILQGAPMPKNSIEFSEIYGSAIESWDGKGLTAMLLMEQVTTRVSSGGGKRFGAKNAGFSSFAKTLLKQEQNRAKKEIAEKVKAEPVAEALNEGAQIKLTDAGEALVVKALKALPAGLKQGLAAHVPGRLSYKEAQALKRSPLVSKLLTERESIGLFNKDSGLVARVEKQAVDTKGAAGRAEATEATFKEIWPDSMTDAGWKRIAENANVNHARSTLISEALLARRTVDADLASRGIKKALRDELGITAENLPKKQTRFTKTLDSLDAKLQKKGYRKDSELRRKIAELRTMQVGPDAASKGAWKNAINDIISAEVPGRAPYKGKQAAQALIEDFREGRLSGINLEDVATVIAAYGYETAAQALEKGSEITVAKLSRWLNGKGGEVIEQAEKEAMERNAYIALSPAHPKDATDTMQALAMLTQKERAEYVRNLEAQWLDLTSIMHSRGYGWLGDSAISSLGPALKRFFVDVKDAVEVIADNWYGGGPTRIIELPGGKKMGIKETFEPMSQYTYFKELLNQIDLYSVTTNFAKQATLRHNLTLHALRFQQTYLALRGIAPAATPSIKFGADEIFQLIGNKRLAKAMANMNKLPAFIGLADILEVLPQRLAEEFWFDGPIRSIPVSVQAEGIRVLISHMSNLKAGEWFTDTEWQAVYSHMLTNMRLHAQKVFPTDEELLGKKLNWVESNKEDGLDKLEAFVRYFLADAGEVELEAPAFKMYERHMENMIYSSIVLKEKAPSGRIINDIRERWEALLENDLTPGPQKMAALREISDELNAYLEIDDIRTDLADALAAQDALVSISQSLTRDDLLVARESAALSIRAAAVAEVKARGSRGGKVTAADIRSARKAFSDEKVAQYVALANARTNLMLDSYMEKISKSAAAQAEYGSASAYDLLNDVMSDVGNANFLIKFSYNTLKKLDYKFGMEHIRPMVGGVQRFTLRNDNTFTKSIKDIMIKWSKQGEIDGNEYLTSAINSLKGVKPEDLAQLLDDLNILVKGFGNRAQVNKISEKAGKEVSRALKRVRALTDENGQNLFRNFDDLRINALIDAATPLLRVFSELAERKPDPRLMNFYLKQAGELPRDRQMAEVIPGTSEEADLIAAIKAKEKVNAQPGEAQGIVFGPDMSPENYFDAWRNMDWDENLKAVNSIHYAMMKSEEWYTIAGEVTRITGARKVAKGEPVPAGYVKLNGVKELKLGDELSGRELYYFLDTDNYVYPAWAIGEIQTLADYLGAPYRQGLGKITQSAFFKRINVVQNFAKQMMTNMRPGNHLMNFMGGVLINDIAGMRNPMNYVYSLRLLNAAGISQEALGVSRKAAEYWGERHFTDLQRTSNLTIKEASNPNLQKEALSILIGGRASYVSWEDLASIVMKNGGFVPWQQSANLDLLSQMANSPNLQALKKQGAIARAWNETSEVVGSWAAHRDDFVRMALLIDTLKKGNWNSLEDGVKGALEKVNRYHPQPQEVSKFNRDVTRHLILFYTWRAKTLGALVGDLLEQPGRLVNWERAYYNYQASQGYQPEYFGSHDPKDEPVRYFQQSNLGILVGGNEYSISIAHPMWDLMGSDGWLSTLKWDANQSFGANAASIGLGTTTNILYSSAPLVENLFVNWLAGRTSNGQDLMRGGITDEEMPTLLQEVANSFGLNVLHATIAYFYPDAINRAKWDTLSADERTQELLRSWFNWSTGARASKFLTDENKKAARAELRTLLKTLNQRGAEGAQAGGRDAVSELLDYLGKSSQGTLGD